MNGNRLVIPLIALLLLGGAIFAKSRIQVRGEQHETMSRGGADAAQHVLDSGGDVNAPSELGQTPLMAAARAGNVDQVHAMLEKGANPNLTDDSGKTAFAWTTYMFGLSLDKKYTEIAKALIDHGLELNKADARGKTNLMIALNHRAIDVAFYLLEKGADAKTKDKNGHTTLHWALKSKATDEQLAKMVEALIKKGADANAKGESGKAPAWIANEANLPLTAAALKKAGAK
jgi:ankyrin repeat protein